MLIPILILLWGCPSNQDLLSSVATSYADYGRVDDGLRAALLDCKASAPQLRMSASRDETTHGRKQYYLYARDRLAYLHAKDLDQPEGQVLVKESWVQRTKGPLFMMLNKDGDWIYATTTPDGKGITASGKLASCIECHESERTRDRMFGLQSYASPK